MLHPSLDSFTHKGQRRQLVQTLRGKGISNAAVLAAIGTVPRHFFFESAFAQHAYQDKAFPIQRGQTISQPYTVARQTELLEIKAGDRVLEIGTGSGYQASVLLELNVDLYTIEYEELLYSLAKVKLGRMGYKANFFHGDGSKGLPQYGPYKGIIVTAGAPAVPLPLMEQLAPGGKLVIPVGDEKGQEMLRITRHPDGNFSREDFGPFSFVPLRGEKGWG
ncbi:MAG: protein-L-isoaspartate(D-aspartate) O-methyltransferase [Bacteroidota bacterium]